MKTYTVGFIFNEDLSKLALVRKTHPDWQKGKLNGAGGKIKLGETSSECIVREIEEETGLRTYKDDWVYVARIQGEDYWVDFYGYIHKGILGDVTSKTDEEVIWIDSDDLPSQVISNLRWLIPMTMDKMRDDLFQPCLIEYK